MGAVGAAPLVVPWSAEACRARWAQGVPLVEAARASVGADDVEDLVAGAMDALAQASTALVPALQRLAEAWDTGRVRPAALLPVHGRVGSGEIEEVSGLSADVVALLATLSLRPALEAVYGATREHLLACHLCGGAWPSPSCAARSAVSTGPSTLPGSRPRRPAKRAT